MMIIMTIIPWKDERQTQREKSNYFRQTTYLLLAHKSTLATNWVVSWSICVIAGCWSNFNYNLPSKAGYFQDEPQFWVRYWFSKLLLWQQPTIRGRSNSDRSESSKHLLHSLSVSDPVRNVSSWCSVSWIFKLVLSCRNNDHRGFIWRQSWVDHWLLNSVPTPLYPGKR